MFFPSCALTSTTEDFEGMPEAIGVCLLGDKVWVRVGVGVMVSVRVGVRGDA